MSCGAGCRCGSVPSLLWLWCRPAATAPIRLLAWEPPYAAGAASEMAKRQKKKREIKIRAAEGQIRVVSAFVFSDSSHASLCTRQSSLVSWVQHPRCVRKVGTIIGTVTRVQTEVGAGRPSRDGSELPTLERVRQDCAPPTPAPVGGQLLPMPTSHPSASPLSPPGLPVAPTPSARI